MKRVYYSMVSSIDDYMGELMDKVSELGLDENTIIVFFSDHGEMFGENGRIFKMIFYDSAAKVPFLVRWKGKIQPGLEIDACLNTPDIMPTLLGMMQLPVPETVEGMDLSPLAFGKKCEEPDFAFMQGMGHTFQWKDGHDHAHAQCQALSASQVQMHHIYLFPLQKKPAHAFFAASPLQLPY